MSDSPKELFRKTSENLKVDNVDTIHGRRDGITRLLNKEFRDSESVDNNRFYIGSFGRNTAIRGVSDLDLLYILPPSSKQAYLKDSGSKKVLERVRRAVLARYPATSVRVDRLVVVIQFQNFRFEIQPVFDVEDGKFLRPDTHADEWKVVNPRAEIEAFSEANKDRSGTPRRLARLVRAWKRKTGVEMNGLLIDTMVFRFFEQEASVYEFASNPDYLVRDFFEFLGEQPKQTTFRAMGSGQVIDVVKNFQSKAKRASKLAQDAIDAKSVSSMSNHWKKVFGTFVPTLPQEDTAASNLVAEYRDTEEFIEDLYEVQISEDLRIECNVSQNGFRPFGLRDALRGRRWLRPQKTLDFFIESTTATRPFDVRWKVLNRGEESYRRDLIRGQIIKGTGKVRHRERTHFRGEHLVECYLIAGGVVIARDTILVPIAE